MNEKKAKLLRKKVYGTNSFRTRKYFTKRHQKRLLIAGKTIVITKFQVFADQLREVYQKLKRSLET